MTHPTDSASLDATLDMLGNSQRYRILVAVADHNPRTEDEFTPDGLAPTGADDVDLDRVKAELHYLHLPKLAEAGYIDWDVKTQTIRRGPNFDEITPLLRLIDDHRDELPAVASVEQLESDKTQHPERVRHHLRAALDATVTAENHFHIREALQYLHIENR